MPHCWKSHALAQLIFMDSYASKTKVVSRVYGYLRSVSLHCGAIVSLWFVVLTFSGHTQLIINVIKKKKWTSNFLNHKTDNDLLETQLAH